ncbi:hypothetical protein PV325_011691 [Microctonus aethiopoides]|nr:hypothetical protein PV325_011691 [Microctonus aethiopoides]
MIMDNVKQVQIDKPMEQPMPVTNKRPTHFREMAPQYWVSNEAAITENPARKPHQYEFNQWENSTFEL